MQLGKIAGPFFRNRGFAYASIVFCLEVRLLGIKAQKA